MSDVWEHRFNAIGVDPGTDADGDGATNLQESKAGTDPFSADSCPRILRTSRQLTNLVIVVRGEPGKEYTLQTTTTVGGEWVSETAKVAADVEELELAAGMGSSQRFYRLAIRDEDGDADGLSDWEELLAGLYPNSAYSNKQIDENGQPMTDLTYVARKLQEQGRISLEVGDGQAIQPDAGKAATDHGLLVIRRGGLAVSSVVVNLTVDGAQPGSGLEGVDFETLPRTVMFAEGESVKLVPIIPLANPVRLGPVLAKLRILPGNHYSIGLESASVVVNASTTPKGQGLTGYYHTNASSTYTSTRNFNPAELKLTRVDPTIDFVWSSTNQPILNNGYYSVRWTGQVQPQYSELYYFVANTDDGVKLWVNDRLIIDTWYNRGAADSIGSIGLVGGLRYNIKMEYYNGAGGGTARIYWYSASQPKQIIPAARLYPASAPAAPSAITSESYAAAFLGQPFAFTLSGANSPTALSATGLPAGLALLPGTGQITGTPLVSGLFQVIVTSSNSVGIGASTLMLEVFDTGSALSREVWTNIPGTSINSLPGETQASFTQAIGGMEGPAGSGQNYAERVRGFFTAPASGNYYFWIAAGGASELWISNDDEPVNKVRRAIVKADAHPVLPDANGTAAREWSLQAGQRSPWLAMEAGKKYYVEILRKMGTGTNDHWSVAWRLDSTGTNTVPQGVVPAHYLSRYFPMPVSYLPGTLYAATMLAQSGASTKGSGTATLRLNSEETEATLKFSSSGLTGPVTGQHIHSDPYLTHPGQIIFDIDDAEVQADGSRTWHISPVGTLSRNEVIAILKEGKAYINLHTAMYPSGEIKGYFGLASGTQTFAPPQAAPAWQSDHATTNGASRFLTQASFGPSWKTIADVQRLGYTNWIEEQFTVPPSYHLPLVLSNVNFDPTTPYPGNLTYNAWWRQAITGPDQLRQRVAFALSEILVVSQVGPLENRATATSGFYDMLLDNSFGNFRELLEAVTLHPAMGVYLDMRGNQKGDLATGRHPNENYAREILQLFSVGLYRMWPDGTLMLNSSSELIPTYDQEEILGFSKVFTGWTFSQPYQANGRLPTNFYPPSNYTNAMVLVPSRHESGEKRVLDNVVLRRAWGAEASSASQSYDAYGLNDLELALDSIFQNENVGPYICRQLIQRLVTSHPTRDYLYRVVRVFNDNGQGERGDMRAVIKAILLDYEARSGGMISQPTFGKQREPLLRVTAVARAFPAPDNTGGHYVQNGDRTISCTVSNAHRLNNGDVVLLTMSDTSGQPAPAPSRYSVTVTGPTSFTVNDPALLSGTYNQAPGRTISNMVSGTVVTTNVIYVSVSSHGLSTGDPVYLRFASGGAAEGVYQVIGSTNSGSFYVTTPEATTRSGSVRVPRINGGYRQTGTNILVSINGTHGLLPGDGVYINFTSGTAADGLYTVVSNASSSVFVVNTTNAANQTQNSVRVYPLIPPRITRSGTLGITYSTWGVGSTDGSLSQTPLKSPTVFNYFLPDYKFPGSLAAAGLTTPEFQLTSDTEVATQMNYLAGGILNNTGNTNGLSSFTAGDGDIGIDIGQWMTPAYTANAAAITRLVDTFSSILVAGQLSPSARTVIVNYVANTANFPYGATPTAAQMRDRVRAVLHLIVVSPDFTVQR